MHVHHRACVSKVFKHEMPGDGEIASAINRARLTRNLVYEINALFAARIQRQQIMEVVE